MKLVKRPQGTEHALYYDTYLSLLSPETNVLDLLKQNQKRIISTMKVLPIEKLHYRYQSGKWCVKDILMHLIDCERVFVYRAMRFARKDKTPLPFFDENEYAIQANAEKLSINRLLREYDTCRKHTLAFFNNLSAKQFSAMGIASNTPTSVRALAWIICGHEVHHIKVLQERYGIALLP